jgi:H+/gluconate symporter-like permease
MDAWLKAHAFFVTAISGAIYMAGGDCRRLSEDIAALTLMIEGVREGFAVMRGLGLPVTPLQLKVLSTWLPHRFAVGYWRRFFASDRSAGLSSFRLYPCDLKVRYVNRPPCHLLACTARCPARLEGLQESLMDFVIALAALCFLMFVAYRGFSVILFAPIAALGAVFLTDPHAVPAAFTSLFMDKMVGFARLYFPVFLLGAVFGKVIETSGFAKSIVHTIISVVGKEQAIMAIVLVCAVLTYGGVSLFVVVFAAYPFATELFRAANIPKRLIPGTIALGAFSFTMDSLPFTPQIQNIIPTTYFNTTTAAAPVLGIIGAIFIFVCGIAYLEWRKRTARAAGEGYGEGHINEPPPIDVTHLPSPWLAFLPLIVVFALNIALGGFPGVFNGLIDWAYGTNYDLKLAMDHAIPTPIPPIRAIWAVLGALLAGIITVFLFAFRTVWGSFAEGSKAAIGGALLAAMNTASEYGFGAVIAALPGFLAIRDALGAIPNPLVREAVTVTSLAGITGSASGGMSIALAAMSKEFIDMANEAHIPMGVLHRIASMASGGMDTLPHNGAVITLLAVCGLTHRESYRDIFAVTVLKTAAVFVVIGFYELTGLY